MAGEDQLTLSDGGTVPDVMTIIPTNGSKLHQANGNGIKHNNINGSIIPNGRDLKIVTVDNGKLAAIAAADEKSTSFHTDFNDEETSCGWGPFKPRWLQRLATKQMFLVIFCITWVKFLFNRLFLHVIYRVYYSTTEILKKVFDYDCDILVTKYYDDYLNFNGNYNW